MDGYLKTKTEAVTDPKLQNCLVNADASKVTLDLKTGRMDIIYSFMRFFTAGNEYDMTLELGAKYNSIVEVKGLGIDGKITHKGENSFTLLKPVKPVKQMVVNYNRFKDGKEVSKT